MSLDQIVSSIMVILAIQLAIQIFILTWMIGITTDLVSGLKKLQKEE